jgi:hypothetical protein
MNNWNDVIEDDDDSETNLQGPMKGNHNDGRRRQHPPTSADRYGLASSIEVYSDDDDLDFEELPEGVVVGQNVPASMEKIPPRRTVLNSIEETEEIAVVDLRNAFDEAAVRNQLAGGGVDKK